ncbi:uncharacterized protein LOC106666250 isoform X2 [Cimex lectularius]|uniref:Uncharacterized protein n=1 Tax=Cimex lectularius TaxID=79782 RepID=A0A8I6RLR2_CIMLE|nr:uncharacterized protein LOC106666250 isoform X2 [Cimex lectularius]
MLSLFLLLNLNGFIGVYSYTFNSAVSSTKFDVFVNVGTVLFTKDDISKPCWNVDDLTLLAARRIMQDLVPKRLPKNFRALHAYVRKCMGRVQQECLSNKTIEIMKKALFDALGGYLHSVAIPLLNEGYYAGNVDYETMAGLHGQLADMMAFLKTDGGGWTDPCDMSKIPTKVSVLPMEMCNLENSCKPFTLPYDHSCESETIIPMPLLDDDVNPSAIAIPLKERSLYSLMSECSVNLLPKYYILAMRCLTHRYPTVNIVNFNQRLQWWILNKVAPHLDTIESWYPGFGGVMRIIETMNQKGLLMDDLLLKQKEKNRTSSVLNSIVIDNSKTSTNYDDTSFSDNDDVGQNSIVFKFSWSWKSILLMILLGLILLWVIYYIIWAIKVKIQKRKTRGYVCIKDGDILSPETDYSHSLTSTIRTYSDYESSPKSCKRCYKQQAGKFDRGVK